MDYDYILSEDFLFFLRLCRDPDQVFKCKSYESCIAQNWLDKLCCYECESLDDRRLRNIYISYLCVCLIEGKLKGPFKELPKPGSLQSKVNFEEPTVRKKCPAPCPMLTIDAAADATSASCPQTAAQPCCCKMEMLCGDAKPPSDENSSTLTAMFNCGSFQSGSKTCDDNKSDTKTMRDDIMSLVASISAELCGKTAPECDPYLESELCRYEKFIKDSPNLSCLLESQPSNEAKRSFLLLSLQNNLLKLMCDTNM